MAIHSAGMDFVALETEVNILSNETRKTVTVPLVNDDVLELSKWFQARLNLTDEQVGVVLSTPEMVNITVVDDDCEFNVNKPLNVRIVYG